jgi:hypothetical protein
MGKFFPAMNTSTIAELVCRFFPEMNANATIKSRGE